jgi:succinoglycan biosynthesis transport protein ExoP
MSAFERSRTTSAVIVRRDAEPPYASQVLPHPSSSDDGIDIKSIVTILRRRLLVISATIAVVTGLVTVLVLNLTPEFRATAALLIEPRQSHVLDVASVLEGLPQQAEVIRTQITLLRSQSYAEKAINELGLLNDPHFNVFLPQESGTGADKAAVSGTTEGFMPVGLTEPANGYEGVPAKDELSEPTAQDGVLAWLQSASARALAFVGLASDPGQPAPEDAVSQARVSPDLMMETASSILLEELEVEQYGDTYVILISYTSTDPETASRIANKFAEIYVKDQLATKQAATARASTWLSERITELRQQVLQAEAAVETYRAEHGLLDTKGTRLNEEQLARLNQDLIMVRAERAEREARLRLIRDLRERGESLQSAPEIVASATIANLRQQQQALQRQEAQLSQEFGPRHPSIVQLEAEKQELTSKIGLEVQNIIQSLDNQVTVARAREQALQDNLEAAMAQSADRNQADVQLRMLEREAEANRSLYTAFLNRFKELNEQQDLLEAGARVMSKASAPEVPSFPRPKLMIAAGFTSSLMLGTLFAFLRERFDSGLRSGRQVEQVLGLPRLGFVPSVRGLGRRGELPNYLVSRPQSAYAEAIRAVQIGLYLSNVDDPPRVILITSSLPGEGKTTLAMSLAVSAAGSGHKTVIVDLDLRRPKVAKMLNWEGGSPGLVEYMAGQASLDDIIRKDPNHSKLDLIPIRRLAANPTDLLASRKMTALLEQLRERYELVILDSAPILGISDTKIAARLADAVLFAVRWGKTKEEVALSGLEGLFESHANVAGAVLTQVNLRRHARYGFGDAAQYYGKYKRYYTE